MTNYLKLKRLSLLPSVTYMVVESNENQEMDNLLEFNNIRYKYLYSYKNPSNFILSFFKVNPKDCEKVEPLLDGLHKGLIIKYGNDYLEFIDTINDTELLFDLLTRDKKIKDIII